MQTTVIIAHDLERQLDEVRRRNPHDFKVNRDHMIVTDNRHKILFKEPHAHFVKNCEADAVINKTDKEELTKKALRPQADIDVAMMQHE